MRLLCKTSCEYSYKNPQLSTLLQLQVVTRMNLTRSSDSCAPFNLSGRLIYTANDLNSANEVLQLAYPNRDNAFENWGHLNDGWLTAFFIYIIIFAVCYFILGTASLLVLMCKDLQGRAIRDLDKKIVLSLVCINVLLVILGYSRLLFFVMDPYYVSNYLTCKNCHIPWMFLDSLSLPSITVAYTMEFFTLWSSVQIVRDSVFDKLRFIVPFSFLNYAIAIVVLIIANVFVYPGIITIITCTVYFILFGLVVCLAYIIVAWNVTSTIMKTARRSTLTSFSTKPTKTSKSTNGGPQPFYFRGKLTDLQKRAIVKISKICYGTAFLGVALSILQVVLLVILSRVLLTDCISTLNDNKDVWLALQYMKDTVKLSMGILLLYCTSDFGVFWMWIKQPFIYIYSQIKHKQNNSVVAVTHPQPADMGTLKDFQFSKDVLVCTQDCEAV